jgi:hypothetical protein
MAQDLAALTNTWMLNPTMFDPSQASNRFSNYNNQAIPWPPTYAGVPVNAATGKPIQSFLDWQAANPGGMSINATPAAPAAAPQASSPGPGYFQTFPGSMQLGSQLAPQGSQPGIQALYGRNFAAFAPPAGSPLGQGSIYGAGGAQQGGQAGGQAAPQPSAPPNNWQAALNALANPGNPVTQGANVPLVQGGQPSGGINNAFLQQAGAGAGMNQNFLSALRAIQARPQQ